MLLFTASCKLAPHASWFCIKMCTDQTHTQRDKVDPIYSFDRSVHPRQSVQEIAWHLTWRVVKTLLAELDAEPQQPPTKTQQKSGEFAVHFSRNMRSRWHSPRHYWGRAKSSLILTCSIPLTGQAQGKPQLHWETNTLYGVTSVMRYHTENRLAFTIFKTKQTEVILTQCIYYQQYL